MKDMFLAFGAGIATGCCLGRLMAAEAARPGGGGGGGGTHLPRRHHVRPAGPEAMRHGPRDWDRVDEQSDESFPASDPPANY